MLQVRVRLWEKAGGTETLVLDAESSSAAVEVGGGPWWTEWSARSEMREPLRTLLSLPVDVGAISERLPAALRPRGL